MYLATSLWWAAIGVAALVVLVMAVRGAVGVIRDRKRQSHDRMLPP